MMFIREFKINCPVNEDSIMVYALDNMFSLTDIKQFEALFTPIDANGTESIRFKVTISVYDGIMDRWKKINTGMIFMKYEEYESVIFGNEESFITQFLMTFFARFPDILNGQEYFVNV